MSGLSEGGEGEASRRAAAYVAGEDVTFGEAEARLSRRVELVDGLFCACYAPELFRSAAVLG